MTQTVTHTGFGLDGTNGAERPKWYLRPQQKGHKSPQRSQNSIQTAAHNPEVGGSSPPPATIKSLEIKRFQGFFLFSNRKGSDQAAEILCTKFCSFRGRNLVQSCGVCRSSPLPCPSIDSTTCRAQYRKQSAAGGFCFAVQFLRRRQQRRIAGAAFSLDCVLAFDTLALCHAGSHCKKVAGMVYY